MAWVTFCISTFNRPQLLKQQLCLIVQQTFKDFEVVVSDNDPGASAKVIVSSLNDLRVKYFHNDTNLGMIKSFNKSIERSVTDYIVMITDDDPVEKEFLSEMYKLHLKYESASIYCGFQRAHRKHLQVEVIKAEDFLIEVLDSKKTTNLLWSSCVMRKSDVLKVGFIPDYGSPHLADHALIALVGSQHGGVIINKMFSSLTSHEHNFSKFNFEYYVTGCKGFYQVLTDAFINNKRVANYNKAITDHLGHWLITNMFSLKKYYTLRNPDPTVINNIDRCAEEILSLSWMKRFWLKYRIKQLVFRTKVYLGF
jgi:glycosyltransferase involved in cell wall biosynthesis